MACAPALVHQENIRPSRQPLIMLYANTLCIRHSARVGFHYMFLEPRHQ